MDTKKIRAKLLDLAVRGKLVSQDPADEPASVLLGRIREERTKLVREKKAKAPKGGESVIYLASDGSRYEKRGGGEPVCIDGEIPFEVPEGWEWARLGDVADVQLGKMLDKSKNSGTLKPYLRNANVQWGEFDLSDINEFRLADDEMPRFRLDYGDLLVCEGGVPGRCAIWNAPFAEMYYQKALHRLRCEPGYDVHYCAVVIEAFTLSHKLDHLMTGSGIKHLPASNLASALVPVPPLAEQRRIVAELDRLLALVDGVERDSADLGALRARARSKVLDLAVRGLLVPQDASDEPASALIARAAGERRALVKAGKAKAPKGGPSAIWRDPSDGAHYEKRGGGEPVRVEVPYDLPEGWAWARLLDLYSLNPKNDALDDAQAAFLPMAAIDDGFANSYHPINRPWREIRKGFTQFADGDIVFAKISPCFENGKYFIARDLPNGIGAGTTELYVLRSASNSLLAEYVFVYLESPLFVRGACKTFMGTVGQQRIKRDYIEDALVPVPPLAEQRRIVDRVEQALGLLTNL